MDPFVAIAAERRALAVVLADATEEQQRTPSLCDGWTVHDVVAHLALPLEVGVSSFVLAMVRSLGDFDRANVRLTSKLAERPFAELLAVLEAKAGSRFTPPGAGPEAPLTDVLVHGLDIRWPLGLRRELPAAPVRTSLDHLAAPGGGVLPRGSLSGLQLVAVDLDWSHGTGPSVRGDAEALLLAMTGRPTALDHLDGEGVPILRGRLSRRTRPKLRRPR